MAIALDSLKNIIMFDSVAEAIHRAFGGKGDRGEVGALLPVVPRIAPRATSYNTR